MAVLMNDDNLRPHTRKRTRVRKSKIPAIFFDKYRDKLSFFRDVSRKKVQAILAAFFMEFLYPIKKNN